MNLEEAFILESSSIIKLALGNIDQRHECQRMFIFQKQF